MSVKNILARGIQAVTLLFDAFGGTMTKMAPPETVFPSIAAGFASLLSLLVLLSVAAAAKAWSPAAKSQYRRILAVIVVTACLAAVLIGRRYLHDHDDLIWGYPPLPDPPELFYVRGTVLTTTAQAYLANNPGLTLQNIVPKFGGYQNRELIWTAQSIGAAKSRLNNEYISFVLAVSLCLFAASEMLIAERKPRTVHRPAKAKKNGRGNSDPIEPSFDPQQDATDSDELGRVRGPHSDSTVGS